MATTSLTTPCTIAQLEDWFEHQVRPLHEGADVDAPGAVTTTSSAINIT